MFECGNHLELIKHRHLTVCGNGGGGSGGPSNMRATSWQEVLSVHCRRLIRYLIMLVGLLLPEGRHYCHHHTAPIVFDRRESQISKTRIILGETQHEHDPFPFDIANCGAAARYNSTSCHHQLPPGHKSTSLLMSLCLADHYATMILGRK